MISLVSRFAIGLLAMVHVYGLSPFAYAAPEPSYVLFTYMGDPATSLTANWQTMSTEAGEPVVHYDTVSRHGVVADYAQTAKGSIFKIDGLENRSFYRVQLTGLQPGETYFLVVGGKDVTTSKELKVKTIAADDSALSFVTGGDMGAGKNTQTLLQHAATYDPDFAVIGGDIAYCNGRLSAVKLWDTWLTYYTESMVTSDGYSVPLLVAIGNHEVDLSAQPIQSPFYFALFGQEPDKSHFVRQFGKNVVFFVLDSGHWVAHKSQVDWLRGQLAQYQNMKYKMAVYHAPLYPTHRSYLDYLSVRGRESWLSLFDEFGLTVAFENHDHTFKRTYLLKEGKKSTDGSGTLYLGDGCFGVGARSIPFEKRWYQEVIGDVQHFWVVNVDADKAVYRAVDINNQVFDVYPQSEYVASAAAKVLASKDSNYSIPAKAMSVDNFKDVGDSWAGGVTQVKLHNPLDYPIRWTLVFSTYGELVKAEGIPEEVIVLEPGASRNLAVTILPEQGGEVTSDKVQMRINARFEMDHPERKKTLVFKGGLRVILEPTKTPK